MRVPQRRAMSGYRIPLIVASTQIIVLVHLIGAADGFGHTASVDVTYSGERVVHEAGSGPGTLDLVFGSLHLLGAVLAIAGAVLLLRRQDTKARAAYIASAACGWFPSPLSALTCLLLAVLAMGTRTRGRESRSAEAQDLPRARGAD